MNHPTERERFAGRLNEILDALAFPAKGKGRQVKLAAIFGVTQTAAAKWLNGEAIPTGGRLAEMAKLLNVSFEFLSTGRGDKEVHRGGSVAEEMNGEYFYKNQLKPLLSKVENVSILSWAQAGAGMNGATKTIESMPCPLQHGPNAFALRVDTDDYMTHAVGQRPYPRDSILFVDPDIAPTSGRRVLVRFSDGSVGVKIYHRDSGRAVLASINPSIPSIIANSDHLILGTIIGSYLPE
jgi:SOS-response transcriptional repressor LexA